MPNLIGSFDFATPLPASQPGEPTWEIARFFPPQGAWTEDDYLTLEAEWPIELADGRLEVLPMPTWLHQLLVKFLCAQLEAYVRPRGIGTVAFGPLPVRLRRDRFREPDVIFLSAQRASVIDRYPDGADLVMEVVSDDRESRHRDLVVKRREYAQAGIREYWVVDPAEQQILVLALEGSVYREAGVYRAGQVVPSVLLAGFTVGVDEVFAAGQTGSRSS